MPAATRQHRELRLKPEILAAIKERQDIRRAIEDYYWVEGIGTVLRWVQLQDRRLLHPGILAILRSKLMIEDITEPITD